jgi:hypothetical protein
MADKKLAEEREKETREMRELFEQMKFDEEVFGRPIYEALRPRVKPQMGWIPADAEDDIEFMNFRREFRQATAQSSKDNKERLAKQEKPFKAPYPEFPTKK